MTMKAYDVSMRTNRRRLRADALVSAVMQEMDRRGIPHDVEREVFRALSEVFEREGVEVITDYHRQEMGLPARGPDGWTLEEIAAFDRRFLEEMMRPPRITLTTLASGKERP